MRTLVHAGSYYVVAGPVINKNVEIGFQRVRTGGFDIYWRFRTRGDHAGLTWYVQFFGWLFELNVHDVRRWDWDADRWEKPDAEKQQE